MDGRPRTDGNVGPGQNSAYRPRSRGRLVLVDAPDRCRGAGIADRARLVHGAQWQGMLAPAEQAIDLDPRPVGAGEKRDMTDAAASDPTPAGDRHPHPRVDRFKCHVSGFPSVAVPGDTTDR